MCFSRKIEQATLFARGFPERLNGMTRNRPCRHDTSSVSPGHCLQQKVLSFSFLLGTQDRLVLWRLWSDRPRQGGDTSHRHSI
jgi:hypothetical protein